MLYEDALSKRLFYQSTKRGCKETDLLLGAFVKAQLHKLSETELLLYAEFLQETDHDIYAWLLAKQPAPLIYRKWLVPAIRQTLAI